MEERKVLQVILGLQCLVQIVVLLPEHHGEILSQGFVEVQFVAIMDLPEGTTLHPDSFMKP